MIAVEPVAVVAARLAELRACDLLERAARWDGALALMIPGAGPGGAAIGSRLRARLAEIASSLETAWPVLAQGAVPDHLDLPGVLSAAAARMARLEQGLRKLPGLPVRAEVYQFLAEVAGAAEPVPPVILVPEDQDLDDDGFLALPIAQAAAPLAWPRLAFGLVSSDVEAARRAGPAYLFALAERGVHGAELSARLGPVALELAGRGQLYPELAKLLTTLGIGAPEPSSEPGPAETVAATRLADGVLASARPTADFASVRAAREEVLGDPDAGAEAVYAALAGLREEPLTGAQILAGAWLFRERVRPDWLREAAAASDPWEAYGRRVMALDALVLKSLETASVHRQLARRG